MEIDRTRRLRKCYIKRESIYYYAVNHQGMTTTSIFLIHGTTLLICACYSVVMNITFGIVNVYSGDMYPIDDNYYARSPEYFAEESLFLGLFVLIALLGEDLVSLLREAARSAGSYLGPDDIGREMYFEYEVYQRRKLESARFDTSTLDFETNPLEMNMSSTESKSSHTPHMLSNGAKQAVEKEVVASSAAAEMTAEDRSMSRRSRRKVGSGSRHRIQSVHDEDDGNVLMYEPSHCTRLMVYFAVVAWGAVSFWIALKLAEVIEEAVGIIVPACSLIVHGTTHVAPYLLSFLPWQDNRYKRVLRLCGMLTPFMHLMCYVIRGLLFYRQRITALVALTVVFTVVALSDFDEKLLSFLLAMDALKLTHELNYDIMVETAYERAREQA